MKRILAVLAIMLALVSCGAATPTVTCDYNQITQTNTATAQAGDSQTIGQTQTNCAMVLGEGNVLSQSNNADATPTAFKTVYQTQSNVAMIVGKANWASQSNVANADCVPAGILTQTQKNALLVIGSSNVATQSNNAVAKNNLDAASTVSQTQSNIGVLLGKKNSLTQSNDATASVADYWFVQDKPVITQTQKNIAFSVNNCGDCIFDPDTSYFGTTKVTWPVLDITKPTVVEPICPTCVEDP